MKAALAAVIALLVLVACKGAYSNLETPFSVDSLSGKPSISDTSITITGPSNKGATSYRDLVNVHVSSEAIGIDVQMPNHQALRIPTEKVSGCAMTCFGMEDKHIDLLVASTGSVLSFPNNAVLTQWCWEQRKQVFPGDIERAWEYSGGTLPETDPTNPQFKSREAYNHALLQSCRGF